jgi:hypothetical protein
VGEGDRNKETNDINDLQALSQSLINGLFPNETIRNGLSNPLQIEVDISTSLGCNALCRDP